MKNVLAAFALLIVINVTGQENELELDPVTITASLQPKPVSQTGRNIISFKGSAFNNLPVNSIDELLRYLPGVEMQMRGPMGAQSDIVIRGGTFQQVLVLLDGVRINDPNTGHFSSYTPIVPAEIERIEVLKGASSAIYGSEAVGGVIHIITKAFAARPNSKKFEVKVQASAGEYGLASANMGAFYQKNKTVLSGGWLSNNTTGQLQRGTRGNVHNNTASLSVTHFFNEQWQLSFRSAYDNRDFGAQNFYTTFLSDTADEEVSTFWSQARLSYKAGSHKISLDAGYKKVKDDYLYNKLSVANQNKSSLFQATIMDEWKVQPRTTLISGVQVIDKGIASNDRGGHNLQQGAVFFVLNQVITDQFIVNPALRIDWNERSGIELVPQLNVSYKLKDFQLRASAGKTIRDADFTERFNNYNKPLVSSGRIGNPSLDAERSFSYEAGVDYFMPALKISATFFQRLQRRLIDYVPTAYTDMPRKENLLPTGMYALAKNIAKVNTAGAEMDVQYYKNMSGSSSVYAGIGLVWLESKSSDSIPSFYISSHAKFMTNFFAEFTCKRILVSMNGIYKHRLRQTAPAIHAELSGDYFVVNAKAAFFIWKKHLSAFTQINNITNEKYSDLLGAVMPGRWVTGGINFVF
jgi:iron complex outermembrane receptor protein